MNTRKKALAVCISLALSTTLVGCNDKETSDDLKGAIDTVTTTTTTEISNIDVNSVIDDLESGVSAIGDAVDGVDVDGFVDQIGDLGSTASNIDIDGLNLLLDNLVLLSTLPPGSLPPGGLPPGITPADLAAFKPSGVLSTVDFGFYSGLFTLHGSYSDSTDSGGIQADMAIEDRGVSTIAAEDMTAAGTPETYVSTYTGSVGNFLFSQTRFKDGEVDSDFGNNMNERRTPDGEVVQVSIRHAITGTGQDIVRCFPVTLHAIPEFLMDGDSAVLPLAPCLGLPQGGGLFLFPELEREYSVSAFGDDGIVVTLTHRLILEDTVLLDRNVAYTIVSDVITAIALDEAGSVNGVLDSNKLIGAYTITADSAP